MLIRHPLIIPQQELVLDFLPPTLNEQINDARSHWTVSASKKKKYTNKIKKLAQMQLTPIKGVVWLKYEWLIKSFARDNDNVCAAKKYIQDGIVEAGIIENDNLTIVQSPTIDYYARSQNEGVIVTLYSKRPYFAQ